MCVKLVSASGGADAGLEILVVQRQRAAATRECAVIERGEHHVEQQRFRRLSAAAD